MPLDCQEATAHSSSKGVDTSFRNLRGALHRYESLVTPISRLVLDIEALIAVAVRITVERAGTVPARSAAFFLDALTDEILLTAAMLADGGDEALGLIRVLDAEYVDPAQQNREVRSFLSRVRSLFIDGKVIGLAGHTSYMIRWLCSAHVFLLNGCAKSVGGPGSCKPATVQTSLQRMQAWVVLCEQVLRAEFPEFEAVSALSAFSLDGQQQPCTRNTIPQETKNSLHRLAQTFSCQADDLVNEFCDFHLRALHHYKLDPTMGHGPAWREAVKETELRPETDARHPKENIRYILAVYMTTCISDSRLERLFSRVQQLIPSQAAGMKSANECRRVVLLSLGQTFDAELGTRAQAVRQMYFRSVRQGCFGRIDQGCKKAPAADASSATSLTERQFLEKRRLALTDAMHTSMPDSAHASHTAESLNLPADVWTERHEKESKFQASKRQARREEALMASTLLEDEVDLQLLSTAFKTRATAVQNRAKRARKENRVQLACVAGAVPSRNDCTDEAVYIADDLRTPAVDEAFAGLNWSRAALSQANYFLADFGETEKAGSLVIWAAVLAGGWLLDPSWACSPDAYTGPAIKFKPALSIKRKLWISPQARAGAPLLSNLIVDCTARAGSKWTIEDQLESWLAWKQKAIDQKSPSAVMALVTSAEEETYKGIGVSHVFSEQSLFEFIYSLDVQSSRLAMSQM